MKKICLVLVALIISGGFFVTAAEAGQLCWQLDSTDDSLDGYLTVTASGGKSTRSLHGAWYIQGSWYWPLAGNMVKRPDADLWFVQLNSTFGDSYLGIMGAVYADTLSGMGRIVRVGATNVAEDATFIKINCKDMPPYTP
jgi:hypothetical protein